MAHFDLVGVRSPLIVTIGDGGRVESFVGGQRRGRPAPALTARSNAGADHIDAGMVAGAEGRGVAVRRHQAVREPPAKPSGLSLDITGR